jgi:3-oxoacyl-[acyl-carrier-protein] synthase-3
MAIVETSDATGEGNHRPRNPEAETLTPKQSRMGRLMGVRVVGIGSSVPEKRIRNDDLVALGCDADWILQRTGIVERRHAATCTATSDLAVDAARRCIEAAKIDPGEIDLVLLGTYTPDMLMPATASLVQDRLGLTAPAFDLQAACASFVFSLITGMQFVASGCNRMVLVIGADCNSRILNPADRQTYPLFGDGAGAVLLAPGSKAQGVLSYAVGSDGSGVGLLCRPMGGSRLPFSAADADEDRHFLRMDGRPVFKWAIRVLRDTVSEVLRASGLTLDDVDLMIFHQANMRIINAAVEDLGIAPDKVFNNVDRFGNTSSASIPLALDEAYQQGLIRPGNHILFSGFGAGLAWGTVLMRWDERPAGASAASRPRTTRTGWRELSSGCWKGVARQRPCDELPFRKGPHP